MSAGAVDSRYSSSSSPITQVQLASAPARPEAAQLRSTPPQQRSFLLALCHRTCCGRGGDAVDGEVAQPLASKAVYVPPAPHTGRPFLPPMQERDYGKRTLVLDLDETLVHSSFKSVPNPDYVIPVEIDGKVSRKQPSPLANAAASRPLPLSQVTDVYVLKHPFVDQFLVSWRVRVCVAWPCRVGRCRTSAWD